MMKDDYQPGETLLVLLEELEGFSARPYQCSAGAWTIGHGHKIGRGEGQLLKAELTRTAARALLVEDARFFGRDVLDAVKVEISKNQLDALVSLVFNIGTGAFRRSTLLKKLNRGLHAAAADEFFRWDKITNPETGVKETSGGLMKRRQAERALFLSPGPGAA